MTGGHIKSITNGLWFLSCFLFFSPEWLYAQGKWELKRNENGIEVYSRTPLTGNLKEIRVICEFNTTKLKLINALKDIDHYNDWVYSTKENNILKVLNPNQFIYHSISNLPWPLKDRDLIVELSVLPDEKHEQFQIQVKSLPDYLPRDKKYVRVPYSLALWNVTVKSESLLKIDYTFSVDPGGSIPAWLVNSTLPVGPYNSFHKLKMLLESPL
ncbi:START domain-containing protein [Mucilaginibacter rubeus]|nr:START domain-containing protein [Mucilaginibacter rubeus]